MNQLNKIHELYLKYNQKICIDSRSPDIKNSIFFAIKGDNFNGNNFIKDALSKGAKYAISDAKNTDEENSNKSIILVDNTLQTLQNLAKHHRESLNIPVIAITGSNGKTTTKDILTQILSSTYKTYSTTRNFNNHIGVPLTILSIKKEHEIAVIEMGANHIGEIERLCEIAQPNHGVITNIGDAHLEGFGSTENIKIAKNELFEYLKKNNGMIIYNSEDSILTELINDYTKTKNYKIPTWHANVPISNLTEYCYRTTPFITIENINSNTKTIQTKLIGKHNINNIIAAIEIATVLKISHYNIEKSLHQFKLKNNRCELVKTKNNRILLDAYNANPTSMSIGILNFIDWNQHNQLLRERLGEHPNMLFILGDMLELGENELQYHEDIIDLLKEKRVRNCILVGKIFNKTTVCKSSQTPSNDFTYYAKAKSTLDAAEILKKQKFTNMSIFIKGSRKLQLEKLIDNL